MKFRTRFFLWVILAVFLIFFRARWAMRPGGYDEECYLQWLHWFLGLPYPQCYSPSHSPGIAVVWWPLGLISLVASKLTSIPFLEWARPLISFSSFALWGFSLFLIDAILKQLRTERDRPVPIWLPLALLANVRLLEHAARLNFWNHPGEFVLALMVVLACLQHRYVVALLVSALVCFIRLNDAPLFLMVAGAFADAVGRGEIAVSDRMKKVTGGVAVVVGIILLYFVYHVGFVTGYNRMSIPLLIQSFSLSRYIQAFVMGYDGLIWISGWFLFCIALGVCHLKKLSWMGRGALLWMIAELALVVGLNGIRNDYGSPVWRYFIGSFAGAVVLWNEVYRLSSPHLKKIGTAVLVLYAIWLPLQMYAFDGVVIHEALRVTFSIFPDGHILQRLEFFRFPFAVFKMMGQSPVGFTFYSWLSDHAIFSSYLQFAKYALRGTELWAMTLATIAAILTEFWLTYSLLRSWSEEKK